MYFQDPDSDLEDFLVKMLDAEEGVMIQLMILLHYESDYNQ